MSPEQQQLEAAIQGLEVQRAVLGDAVVQAAIAPLRARLATLATALPALPNPAQALRQVTILFLDVVGSTTLSRQLDPEDIHEVMDGALGRCTAIVEALGGKVLQYAGDNLLAVFGADETREDDAERATHTGLALLAEGRRLGEEVQREHGHAGFDVRVGLHTGGVLLGGGVDAEGSIRGLAVNIAARMEQTAPAGALRISRDTYRHVRGLFDVEPQPPIEVKGLDEPVVTYLVQRARPRAFRASGRGIEGIETAMVGRDAELAQFTRALDEARAQRELRMITVVADAGLGKSRLLLEVERRLERDPAVRLFHGRAQRHGLHQPHGVIRDLLAWHCDILDSDSLPAARAKLALTFGAPFGARAEEQCALVGQLIGLDFSTSPHIAGILKDGRQIRARAFHAVAQYLRLLCSAHAGLVVVLLDDLHWADDGSLDFITHVCAACRDLPLLFACLTRPALFERRGQWGEGVPHALRIVLHPLADHSCAVLVDTLLARITEAPPELRELLVRSAEGNPFHMEELLAMLIDDGVLARGPGGWQVDHGRLTEGKVPPTLTAVLQARLDALPTQEKRALQHDSVIGHVFWDAALQAVAPESIETLETLERRELIHRRDGSAFAGTREYAFKHHVLHQVTYDTVLKRDKRELHRRAAQWLVVKAGGRVGEHLGLIAEHFERAGDAAHAALYLRRTAEAAYDAADYGTALGHIERAAALTPQGDLRARFDLLAVRLNVYNATGRRNEQADDVAAQERYAEALDDNSCRARAARWRSLLSVVTGDYPAAITAANRAQALAALTDDPEPALGALLDKGQALIYMGDAAAAQACLEALLPLASASGKADIECAAMNRLNVIAQERGDFVAARAYLSAALGVARESGNRRFEGALMGNIGVLETLVGHYDAARELMQAGLSVARAIGDHGGEPYALSSLASVTLAQGDARAALAMALEARAMAREVADRGCEAQCNQVAGAACAELGDVTQALACFDAYETWARQASAGKAAPPPTAARAELALTQGQLDEALVTVTHIVAWLDTNPGDVDTETLKRLFVCHRVLAAAGAPRADEFLTRAHATLLEQARALPDTDRAAYLGNIRLHRDIVAARASRPGESEPPPR